MSDELFHECGVAALCWLKDAQTKTGPASRSISRGDVTPMIPSILLDLQNRGQLAAGITSYNTDRRQVLDTFKDVGTVAEVFRMAHPAKFASIIEEYAGSSCIGHTRYATCGADDARYAQPFERHHGRLWKWFSFAFNGNLANYSELRERLLSRRHYHVTLDTDTEIVMHSLAYRLRGEKPPSLRDVMASMARVFDGSYYIAQGLVRGTCLRDHQRRVYCQCFARCRLDRALALYQRLVEYQDSHDGKILSSDLRDMHRMVNLYVSSIRRPLIDIMRSPYFYMDLEKEIRFQNDRETYVERNVDLVKMYKQS